LGKDVELKLRVETLEMLTQVPPGTVEEMIVKFEDYKESGRALYADLAQTVAAILTAAIRTQPELRLQHVQHRAKDPDRLRAKLEKLSALTGDSIETVVKDSAGSRLVFYTNSDVSRFQGSGIVSENFDIDWSRTKIHHPRPDASEASELFISNNYVVKLKDTRVLLPEYARFRGLWCEVQVQTSLNHAWSEMAHDTIYKQPELKGFGGALMRAIDERMHNIMRKFLIPAGYEFQKVQSDFERLSSGKDLFDRGALAALADCDDNNARYELLERFGTYVLPNYDDIKSEYAEIRSALVAAVHEARATQLRPIETPFGNLPGKSDSDVAEIVADILERLRYVDVDATFDSICELYPGAQTDEERQRWLRVAERLSHHELEIWKQAGPIIQSLLVERIATLPSEKLDQIRPVVLKVLEQVLEPEVSGTTSTYNTVTFHHGTVAPSDMLTQVRSAAIDSLNILFRGSGSDGERRVVIDALLTATRTPHRQDPPEKLVINVLSNALRIVQFFSEVAESLSYELLQSVEHHLLWLFRHNRARPNESEAVATAREALIQAILMFRDAVNADKSFVLHKTLVGFESVFPPEWEDDGLNIKARESYREERIDESVEQVTEETSEEWLRSLSRAAQTESNDLATFPSFGQFLEKLGHAKPHIVFGYLDQLEGNLANFLTSMLSGLEQSEVKGAARKKVWDWVERKVYLRQIIHYLRFTQDFDAVLLEKAVKAAIEADDDVAVRVAVGAANDRHGDVEGGLLDTVFLPAIGYLTSKDDMYWINAVWPRSKGKWMFRALSSGQANLVLGALVSHPEIDYQREEILSAIAENNPEKVVDFFGQRLQSKAESEMDHRYDAIPFRFHFLHETLGKIPDYLIDSAKSWFMQDPSLFAYRGGRLVSNVYPTFSLEYEQKLISLVRTGDKADLEFVIALLRGYEGQTFIHEVSKEAVNALPPGDPLLVEIEIALESTGVMTGEFGRVTALTERMAEVEPWLNDPRDKVRAFAEKYRRDLENQIAVEQRRSEESLELRKRDYGEGMA
jgi:ppGpp synthetase/RelA/SpoT-type nucleotidyltranferase